MCGIAGIINKSNSNTADTKTTVERMCQLMEHRGPDDSGFHFFERGGLGMRRLSVIDLESGQQPMYNPEQSIWVVQNGEIYNHIELRQELEGKGYQFKTQSDTEVLVYAYEEYGLELAEHLNGMFAIAIWDAQQKQLHLIRDRLGIKPLYYYEDTNFFIFASELQCIYGCGIPELNFSISKAGLNEYFSFGYISAPHSIFEKVHKLPAGHTISITTQKALQPQRYWHLPYSHEISNIDDAREELSLLLKSSVQLRLRSNVPVGAFLSGGMDSSLIASYLSEELGESSLNTFSVGYSNNKLDESRYAKQIASILNTKHHDILLDKVQTKDIISIFQAFGEPFYDSSAIPTYFVSQLARKHVTVALSGDGGDELFMGYRHYQSYQRAFQQVQTWNTLKRYIPLLKVLEAHSKFSKWYSFPKYLFEGFCPIPLSYKHQWVPPDIRKRETHHLDLLLSEANLNDPDSLFSYLDLHHYHSNDILVKVDRMSMKNSLEARVPLLDYRIVEFAAKLHPSLKYDNQQKKKILLSLFKQRFTKTPKVIDIVNRPKHGFNFPYAETLYQQLREPLESYLKSSPFLNEFGISPTETSKIINNFYDSRANTRLVWLLFVLGCWYDGFQNLRKRSLS